MVTRSQQYASVLHLSFKLTCATRTRTLTERVYDNYVMAMVRAADLPSGIRVAVLPLALLQMWPRGCSTASLISASISSPEEPGLVFGGEEALIADLSCLESLIRRK